MMACVCPPQISISTHGRDAGWPKCVARPYGSASRGRWVLMEICGGQTHAIMRYGLDELLPAGNRTGAWAGVPGCVAPLEIIDKALDIAARPE